MQITVTLTPEQVKAVKRLDLTDNFAEFAQKAVLTSLRGKFKYFADKAEVETAKLYKSAVNCGAFTATKSEKEFTAMYMQEVRDILSEL